MAFFAEEDSCHHAPASVKAWTHPFLCACGRFCAVSEWYKKAGKPASSPPAPSIMRGCFLASFCCTMFSWISCSKSFQITMKKSSTPLRLALLFSKASKRWFIAVILLTAVLCMGVLLVVRSNSFLFAAKAVSALPVVISILSSVLLPCLSKSSNLFIDIAFLPSLRSFASSFAEIALYSTAFFIPFAMSFFACSANSIKLSVSLLVSFAFSIPLVVASNGILTFTFSSLKSLSGVLLLGSV